jgi:hypothetical protein
MEFGNRDVPVSPCLLSDGESTMDPQLKPSAIFLGSFDPRLELFAISAPLCCLVATLPTTVNGFHDSCTFFRYRTL